MIRSRLRKHTQLAEVVDVQDFELDTELDGVLESHDLTTLEAEGDPHQQDDPSSDGEPPAVAVLVTVRGAPGGLALSWNEPPNRDPLFYKVYYATVSGFTPDDDVNLRHTVFTNDYLLDGLTPGALYYVKVVACDADGEGPTSIEVSGKAGVGAHDVSSADSVWYRNTLYSHRIRVAATTNDIVFEKYSGTEGVSGGTWTRKGAILYQGGDYLGMIGGNGTLWSRIDLETTRCRWLLSSTGIDGNTGGAVVALNYNAGSPSLTGLHVASDLRSARQLAQSLQYSVTYPGGQTHTNANNITFPLAFTAGASIEVVVCPEFNFNGGVASNTASFRTLHGVMNGSIGLTGCTVRGRTTDDTTPTATVQGKLIVVRNS